MASKQIEQQREELRLNLGQLVTSAEKVNEVMSSLKHSRGQAQRSLKHRSGDYIVHGETGFLSDYTDEKTGQKYRISIHRVSS
ncbi:MAG TPA: hypothetical protein VHA12_02550 [Candidatus Nanoarchaeia archaeon]|nr:hypothetical protein [Candidatus Nanoarchaeia archaeon]